MKCILILFAILAAGCTFNIQPQNDAVRVFFNPLTCEGTLRGVNVNAVRALMGEPQHTGQKGLYTYLAYDPTRRNGEHQIVVIVSNDNVIDDFCTLKIKL